jgi:hypothetical protein
MTINAEQRQMMRSALGLPNAYYTARRNCAYVNYVSSIYDDWLVLVVDEYARVESPIMPNIFMFFLTPRGVKACLDKNEKVSQFIWK